MGDVGLDVPYIVSVLLGYIIMRDVGLRVRDLEFNPRSAAPEPGTLLQGLEALMFPPWHLRFTRNMSTEFPDIVLFTESRFVSASTWRQELPLCVDGFLVSSFSF